MDAVPWASMHFVAWIETDASISIHGAHFIDIYLWLCLCPTLSDLSLALILQGGNLQLQRYLDVRPDGEAQLRGVFPSWSLSVDTISK